MEIDKAIDDWFALNIITLTVGNSSPELTYKINKLLNIKCKNVKISISNEEVMKEVTKTSMPNRDWSSGPIFINFLESMQYVEWKESQMHYSCHGAFLIYDTLTADLNNLEKDIAKIQTQLRNDHISVYRLLVLNSKEEQQKLFEVEKNAVFLKEYSDLNQLEYQLEVELQIILGHIATNFNSFISNLKSEQHTIPLFNPKEEIPKDQSKLKKRKFGRSLKLCGDLCLLFGSLTDANNFYKSALDNLKANDDYLWIGKVFESQGAIILYRYKIGELQDQAAVENDVINKMKEASENYRKVKNIYFDTECLVKCLRIYRDFGNKIKFIDWCRVFIDNATFETPDDYFKIVLKFAGFAIDLGLYRKAGLFIRFVAATMAGHKLNEKFALQLFLHSFPLYNMPLTKEIYPDYFPKTEFFDYMKNYPSLPKNIKRTWPKLQLQLINDILGLTGHDPTLQAKLIAIVLHYFVYDLDANVPYTIFNELIRMGNSINKSVKLDLTYIPGVIKIIPEAENLKVNVKEIKTKESGGVFIFNPWKKAGNTDYNWMVGNLCYVKVQLKNVFKFEIFIDSLMLVTEGVECICYPTSLTLKASSDVQELTLKFKPLGTGQLSILGLTSKFTNFVGFHPIDSKGIKIEEPTGKEVLGIRNIPIKDKVNAIKIYFEENSDKIEFFECSHFSIKAILENNQECVITIQKIQVSFAFNDNSTLDKELIPNTTDLKPYEVLSLVIHRSLDQDANTIQSTYIGQPHAIFNTHEIPNIDKLFKIYLKIIYFEKERPSIQIEENLSKEVNLKKGLAIQKVNVYDSLVQNQIEISGKVYEHYNIDDMFHLIFDVTRGDFENKDEFNLLFNVGASNNPNKINVEKIMSQQELATKVILTLNRTFLINNSFDSSKIKDFIFGRWKKLNSINNGYFFFDDNEFRTLKKKIESRNLSVTFDLSSIKKTSKNYEAECGKSYAIKVKIAINEKLSNSKTFFSSLVITDNMDDKSLSLESKENGVLIHGKRTFKVELSGNQNEKTHNVTVLFTEKKMFKIFCFLVDENNGIIYSYKHPDYISVQ